MPTRDTTPVMGNQPSLTAARGRAGSAGTGFATIRVTSARIATAESGLPRARSSITRSSIDTANVTPAALITCRSIGASSHGLVGSRVSGGVLLSRSCSVPTRSPLMARSARAGSAAAASWLAVGKSSVMSNTPSWRIATTDGPARSGRQIRPISAAPAKSSGRMNAASVVIGMVGNPREVMSVRSGQHRP